MMPTPGDREINDELRLKDLMAAIWQYRLLIIAFVLGSCVVVTSFTFVVPKKYAASIIVAPVSENPGNQAGVLGSLTSNIATLAGVSANSDPKKVESVAILQSGALTERYIQTNNLLPVLYKNLWDPATAKWKTTKPDKVPTLWKANVYFHKQVGTITTDTKTGLVTLTVEWTDPVEAATWANGLVKMTNDYERDKAITESEQNIAYLTEQASKNDVIEIKRVIYQLLESEFNKAMLAKGNREYAFKIIDPAAPPERASYPQKLVWIFTALFASLSISVFAVFCLVAWRKS